MSDVRVILYYVWVQEEYPQEYLDALHKAYELEDENYHTEAGQWFDKADELLDNYEGGVSGAELFTHPAIIEWDYQGTVE